MVTTDDREKTIVFFFANFVRDYDQMKKENIGLLFYDSVGSGKTYLAYFI